MLRVLVVVAAVTLVGCRCGPPCRASCEGCCTAVEQLCEPGTHRLACGLDAGVCKVCRDSEICWRGECGTPGVGGFPEVLTSGSFGGGTGSTGGAGVGGSAGGAGGGMVVPPPPTGHVNDTMGRMCSQEGTACPDFDGVPLLCLPVSAAQPRTVCQASCGPGGGCEQLGGLCRQRSSSGCTECERACPNPDGSANGCRPGERCLRGSTAQGFCSPDCRYQGARCPSGSTCQGDGLCSGGAVIRRCDLY